MASTWEEIVAAQEDLLPDVQKQIEAQRQIEVDALDKQRAYQIGLLQKQLEKAAQQAYITREMQKRDTPAYLAQQGLTGGYTETAANDFLRGYRNTVNAANNTYSTNLNDLENTFSTNLANTNTTYAQMLNDAQAQRRAEALQRSLYAAQYGGLTPVISTGESGGGSSGGGSGGGGGSITPYTQPQSLFGYKNATLQTDAQKAKNRSIIASRGGVPYSSKKANGSTSGNTYKPVTGKYF